MELTELPEKMEYHLAEGYRVIPFDARYSQDWVRLHVALGQLANFAQGMQYFKETFLSQPEKVKKHHFGVYNSKYTDRKDKDEQTARIEF